MVTDKKLANLFACPTLSRACRNMLVSYNLWIQIYMIALMSPVLCVMIREITFHKKTS